MNTHQSGSAWKRVEYITHTERKQTKLTSNLKIGPHYRGRVKTWHPACLPLNQRLWDKPKQAAGDYLLNTDLHDSTASQRPCDGDAHVLVLSIQAGQDLVYQAANHQPHHNLHASSTSKGTTEGFCAELEVLPLSSHAFKLTAV